jgi:hypothetical protein
MTGNPMTGNPMTGNPMTGNPMTDKSKKSRIQTPMPNTYPYLRLTGLLAVLSASLASCNQQLDLRPETSISDASYWNKASDLQQAANVFYFSLPPIESNDNSTWSDDAYGLGPNTISNGSRIVPGTDGTWSNSYALIRNCNNLLEKAGRVADPPAVARYRGEARFFRAWAYFELVKRYGDVPLVLRTFDITDTLLYAARTQRGVVVDTMYADLDFAIANLPEAASLANADYGRVTKGAALALKARVGLHEGSWHKFRGTGEPAKHLAIALGASDQLIQSGQYSLFTYAPKPDSSYYYLFQYAGEGRANRENILARLYGQNQQNSIQSHQFVRSYLEGARITPTRALVDSYLYSDGLPPEKSPLRQTPTGSMSEFESRDPRLGMSVFNRNAWFITNRYVPNFIFSQTGYQARKYFIVQDWAPNISFVDNIVIRYAEVLLINAEANYELNGSISDEVLDKTINLIRKRVNMPSLTNAFAAANGLDMRQEIRRERRVELALEGSHRYFDLLRWKTAETELPKPVLGVKFFPDEYPGVTRTVNDQGYVVVEDASRRSFNASRDYLWPLPSRETGLNPNLRQNPNWAP